MNMRVLSAVLVAIPFVGCSRQAPRAAMAPPLLPTAKLIIWIERDVHGDLSVIAREPAYFVALRRSPEGQLALITPTAESGDSSSRAWASSYAEFHVGFRPAAAAPPLPTAVAPEYTWVPRSKIGADGKPVTVYEPVERVSRIGSSSASGADWRPRGFVVVFASTSPFSPETIDAARAALRRTNSWNAELVVARQLFDAAAVRWQASRVDY
ncbi:MAG TPA: hypothetical protein VHM67_15550 [Gemmatimonadaceae bacterium]|nr:hypothetical protein [Gemmatimonadaceae bacterium]